MMDGIYQSWQNGVMWACLGALGAMAVGLVVIAFARAWGGVRRWWSLPFIERVVAAVFVVGFAYYGSTKHGAPSVRWDDGLADNGTLITNDTVAVRWTYSGIPSASSVFIDYREAGSTNKWLNLAETLASAQEWTGTLANATNYEYWVYSTYVPPVPVHTNGVWVGQAYETKARVGAKSFLILNGLVQEHGRTIATPAAKRKDAERVPYDSEVEYLESTGTQRIEIGMTFDARCVLDATFQFTRFVNAATCHGQTSATAIQARFAFGKGAASWNDWYCGIGNKNFRTGKALDLAVHRFVVDAPGDKFVIDDTTYNVGWTSFDLPSNPNSATLYNRARVNAATFDDSGVYGKLYCCKIWQDGVLVRDFIPVRVGTTGAIYDRRGVGGMNGDGTARNDGLYFNRGTGNFGYGNDK